MTHYEVDGQLWCSTDTVYCTEDGPCACCVPTEAMPEGKAAKVAGKAAAQADVEGEVSVRHVSDSDAGSAGEAHGTG
jgi:hypothetical protein